MPSFDEGLAIDRLQELYRERGEELASEVIIRRARQMSGHTISLYGALDRLESELLSHNPNPERWE